MASDWNGLIGTGIAGAVIWVYIARTDATRDRLTTLEESGIERVFTSRAAQIREEYSSRLDLASSNIDIIGFGLRDFKRDYLDQLGALSSKARIRILLIDPTSPYCDARDVEENQSRQTISGEAREFLRRYKEAYGGQPDFNRGNMQVRTYTSMPLVNIFRIDNDLFWGPYLAGLASGNTITVRVRIGGAIFPQLMKHFDETWERFAAEPTWP